MWFSVWHIISFFLSFKLPLKVFSLSQRTIWTLILNGILVEDVWQLQIIQCSCHANLPTAFGQQNLSKWAQWLADRCCTFWRFSYFSWNSGITLWMCHLSNYLGIYEYTVVSEISTTQHKLLLDQPRNNEQFVYDSHILLKRFIYPFVKIVSSKIHSV